MEYLDQAAVYLMQKGDSTEALRVTRELEEFRSLSRRVLQRVATTQMYIDRLCVAQVCDISLFLKTFYIYIINKSALWF